MRMMFLDHETSVGSEEEASVSTAEENKDWCAAFWRRRLMLTQTP
jgi:hypothetical protein